MARSWNEILHDNRIDDEGNYDYLAEELPEDYSRWEWGVRHCDNCGKYRRLSLCSAHYFYCWDGWDSMSWDECWRCQLRAKLPTIRGLKRKLKNKIKKQRERTKTAKWGNFIKCSILSKRTTKKN